MIEIVLRKMYKVTKHYGNFNLLPRNSLVKMVMNQAVTQHNIKAKTKKNRDSLSRIPLRELSPCCLIEVLRCSNVVFLNHFQHVPVTVHYHS